MNVLTGKRFIKKIETISKVLTRGLNSFDPIYWTFHDNEIPIFSLLPLCHVLYVFAERYLQSVVWNKLDLETKRGRQQFGDGVAQTTIVN
jgi:hypothetical protein